MAGSDIASARIVDLGCLEGGYTLEFARMGMETIGIEVRKIHYDNCLYVKNKVNLQNLTFIHDDVWNIEKYGRFDFIFCCGLLYHLDKPRRFLEMLGSICDNSLIINTHFSTDIKNGRFALGDLVENEGVPGRWFHEHPPIHPTWKNCWEIPGQITSPSGPSENICRR